MAAMDGDVSAVVVLAPAAERAVGKHRARHDPAATWGVPAHVTVLYPFVHPSAIDEDVLARLRGAVATVPRFAATLASLGWFGAEVLWLAPEPVAAFRTLTAAVFAAFPDHPPYGGAHAEVVPHLTVGHGASVDLLREAEQEILAQLPVRMDVTHAHLLCGRAEPGGWRAAAELPLRDA